MSTVSLAAPVPAALRSLGLRGSGTRNAGFQSRGCSRHKRDRNEDTTRRLHWVQSLSTRSCNGVVPGVAPQMKSQSRRIPAPEQGDLARFRARGTAESQRSSRYGHCRSSEDCKCTRNRRQRIRSSARHRKHDDASVCPHRKLLPSGRLAGVIADCLAMRHSLAREMPCFLATCVSDKPERRSVISRPKNRASRSLTNIYHP
jgi:hypothetical protein